MLCFKGPLFFFVLDEKLLPMLICWLKLFTDWLGGLNYNGNCSNIYRNLPLVMNYLNIFLNITDLNIPDE